MAGVILAETGARAEIEERFLSFRDLFAALFFFVFGLTIDVAALETVWWMVVLAICVTVVGKLAAGYAAGLVGGFTRRQSLNVGAALVAHGEFTIILAQLAAGNAALALADRDRADGICRPLRARHGDDRGRAHEGVEANRPPALPRNLTPRLQGGAMTIELRQTRLPGVGVKYAFTPGHGGRIAVILHNDGMREIYFFRSAGDEEPCAVITLDDEEARQLGAVLGGAYDRPTDRRGPRDGDRRARDRVGAGARRQPR